MGTLKTQEINRVVVRGTNWVGDAMMTVPALRALRHLLPRASITLATKPSAKELFEGADFVDEFMSYDRSGPWSAVKQSAEWRRRNFDLAVLFPNSFEAALIPVLARVPRRIGYETDGRGRLLTNPLRVPAWRSSRHEIYYYLNIVNELEAALGGQGQIAAESPDGSFHTSDSRHAEAVELLRAEGVVGERPLIALCPGSINSRAKRWPPDRFALLADMLRDELGADILLIGSPEELKVSREVTTLMRQSPVMLTGKTSLAQLAGIISLVDLLITNDTGPAHIAAAMGRPTLVIFGPTNPLTTSPFSPDAEIVRHPPDCAPCMLRDCPIDHRCMTAISPQEVLERARFWIEKETLVSERKTSPNELKVSQLSPS